MSQVEQGYFDTTIWIRSYITEIDDSALTPDTIVYHIYEPDGTEVGSSPFTPSLEATGQYIYGYPIPAAGPEGTWLCVIKITKDAKPDSLPWPFIVLPAKPQ